MKKSAGLLLYKTDGEQLRVLLVHPGGPFWAKKDEHAWSIPKGEAQEDEALLAAAKREFAEEIGQPAPDGIYEPLGEVRASNKTIAIWALAADLDLGSFKSNTFTVEWPPKSGQLQEFPENDRAEWLAVETAATKLVNAQLPFLATLLQKLDRKTVPQDKPPEQTRLL